MRDVSGKKKENKERDEEKRGKDRKEGGDVWKEQKPIELNGGRDSKGIDQETRNNG